jgi:type I restriction enzyme, S subunit
MRPYMRAANVTWNGLDLSDVKEMNFEPKEAPRFELHPGDLLLAEASGSASEVGKPVLWRGEVPGACFQNTLLRVQTDGPLPEYLFYYFKFLALTGAFARGSRGVGIHHLGKLAMEQFEVPLAPLAEQQRVVDAVEQCFMKLEAAQVGLAQARDRLSAFESRLYLDAFAGVKSWQRLADVADVITKGTTPTSVGFEYQESGVLFVKAESLVGGRIDHALCARIGSDAHAMLKRSQLQKDDLLITIAGTLGRTGIVRTPDLPSNTNQAVSIVRFRDKKSLEVAYRWLSSPVAQRRLASLGRGVGLQNLNLRQIGDIEVPEVDPDGGADILNRLDRSIEVVAALRSSLDQAAVRATSLRRSILSAAFIGRITFQDPEDEPASELLNRLNAARTSKAGPASRKVTV